MTLSYYTMERGKSKRIFFLAIALIALIVYSYAISVQQIMEFPDTIAIVKHFFLPCIVWLCLHIFVVSFIDWFERITVGGDVVYT